MPRGNRILVAPCSTRCLRAGHAVDQTSVEGDDYRCGRRLVLRRLAFGLYLGLGITIRNHRESGAFPLKALGLSSIGL